MTRLVAILFLFGCAPSDPLPKPDPKDGFQMEMRVTAKPGEEVWKCQIGPLPLEETAAVNRVEHVQSPQVHHMDVMVILNSGLNVPPGTYDCDPFYKQYPKLMEETILYASQLATDTIQLPKGIAARLPPGLTIMSELHYVNASPREQEVFSKINAYTIPPAEVTGGIWGQAIRDRYLNLPPKTQKDEWSRCVMTHDVDLLFMATHTHRLATDAKVYRWDGQKTGELVYENRDWQSPQLKAFDKAPLHLKKGEGFEYHCNYFNDNDHEVKWGFTAEEEMCNLAIVYTPGDTAIDCTVVETSDGVIMR